MYICVARINKYVAQTLRGREVAAIDYKLNTTCEKSSIASCLSKEDSNTLSYFLNTLIYYSNILFLLLEYDIT
jgi:hypothetical protein